MPMFLYFVVICLFNKVLFMIISQKDMDPKT